MSPGNKLIFERLGIYRNLRILKRWGKSTLQKLMIIFSKIPPHSRDTWNLFQRWSRICSGKKKVIKRKSPKRSRRQSSALRQSSKSRGHQSVSHFWKSLLGVQTLRLVSAPNLWYHKASRSSESNPFKMKSNILTTSLRSRMNRRFIISSWWTCSHQREYSQKIT